MFPWGFITRLNLLIISDNQLDSEAMATFLASLGHEVQIIPDIDLALDHIANLKPELVFVNEQIKNSNAQDFIIKASQKKVFIHSAFLLMTPTVPDETTKIKFMSLGFSYFTLNAIDEKNCETIKFCLSEEINLIQLLKAS